MAQPAETIEERRFFEGMTYRYSEPCDQIVKALLAAQRAMKPAIKDATNPHLRNKYADISAVNDATMGPLNDNGIFVTQPPATDGNNVSVVTRLWHESGQWFECELRMAAASTKPQDIGSTITYARRYSLTAIFNLSTEDDDGISGSGIREPRPTTQPKTPIEIPKREAPKPEPPAQSVPQQDPKAILQHLNAELAQQFGMSEVDFKSELASRVFIGYFGQERPKDLALYIPIMHAMKDANMDVIKANPREWGVSLRHSEDAGGWSPAIKKLADEVMAQEKWNVLQLSETLVAKGVNTSNNQDVFAALSAMVTPPTPY